MKNIKIFTMLLVLLFIGSHQLWAESYIMVSSAVAPSLSVNLRNTGVYNHRLTWTGKGTRTSCSVKVQQSVDNASWTDLITEQSCTADGSATATGYANYVRINVITLTGAGNVLYSRYDGSVVQPSASSVTATTNADTSEGTTAPTKYFTVGGKSNDGTAQYKMLPLGASGRSVIMEGFAGGTAVPVSGAVTATVSQSTASNLKGQFTLMDGTGAANDGTHGIYVLPVTAGFPVTLATAPLPSDAATQTTLAALLTYLQTGDTTYNFISTASANLTNVKASAGVLHSLTVFNPGATVQYLRLYDKATAPDPSACSANSDCPVAYYPIPANGDSLVAGFSIPLGIYGKAFASGIGYSISGAACTVRSTCTDETNSAAGVVIDMSYK